MPQNNYDNYEKIFIFVDFMNAMFIKNICTTFYEYLNEISSSLSNNI